MQDIVDIIVNNGIGIACVVYLIYDKLTFSKAIDESLKLVNQSLAIMNERLLNLETKKTKKEGK